MLQLHELLARAGSLVGGGVIADQLREIDASVRRVAHLQEEVPLSPQRGRRPVALRILQRDVVEFRDRLVLLSGDGVATRRPVEGVVGERRVAVIRREAVQLRDGTRAVLPRKHVENGEIVRALGHVDRACSGLLARDLAPPFVVFRGGRGRLGGDGGGRGGARGRAGGGGSRGPPRGGAPLARAA